VRGDGTEERHHGARRLLVEHLIDCGRLLPQRDAVGVGDFFDQPRLHADSVVGEDRVAGHLLFERDFHRAQSHRQVGGNVAGDAEAVGHFDDILNAYTRGQLEGGMLRDSAKALSSVIAPL